MASIYFNGLPPLKIVVEDEKSSSVPAAPRLPRPVSSAPTHNCHNALAQPDAGAVTAALARLAGDINDKDQVHMNLTEIDMTGLASVKMIPTLRRIMEIHSTNPDVLTETCRVLNGIATSPKNKAAIAGTPRLLTQLFQAIIDHPEHEALQQHAWTILHALFIEHAARQEVTDETAQELARNMLHQTTPENRDEACAALAALTTNPRLKSKIASTPGVTKFLCRALATLPLAQGADELLRAILHTPNASDRTLAMEIIDTNDSERVRALIHIDPRLWAKCTPKNQEFADFAISQWAPRSLRVLLDNGFCYSAPPYRHSDVPSVAAACRAFELTLMRLPDRVEIMALVRKLAAPFFSCETSPAVLISALLLLVRYRDLNLQTRFLSEQYENIDADKSRDTLIAACLIVASKLGDDNLPHHIDTLAGPLDLEVTDEGRATHETVDFLFAAEAELLAALFKSPEGILVTETQYMQQCAGLSDLTVALANAPKKKGV